jgi:hypothetical protein
LNNGVVFRVGQIKNGLGLLIVIFVNFLICARFDLSNDKKMMRESNSPEEKIKKYLDLWKDRIVQCERSQKHLNSFPMLVVADYRLSQPFFLVKFNVRMLKLTRL